MNQPKNKSREMGLYIHIPFCKQKCYYCDFPSYAHMEAYWEAYVDALIKELNDKGELYSGRAIKTIFIGGGTPSLLATRDINRIFEAIHARFTLVPGCETTIESNPGTLDAQKLKVYRQVGINRLSMGLQAGQDRLLKALGCIHTFEDFKQAVYLAQKHGFININADIIFGIPEQTMDDWHETVQRLMAFELTHLSCYSLKIEEHTVFGSLRDEGKLSEMDDELDRCMYHYAVEKFMASGFPQYEISNFAKPQYVCKHNMNYWERGEYIGLGAGAHSFTDELRYANTPDVRDYIAGIQKGTPVITEENAISKEEALSEAIILGLRLNMGIDLSEVSHTFGVDVASKFSKELSALTMQKLVEQKGSVIRLTAKGLDLANQVFIQFI
ncbi:MAG: radical SAM family heme chaperone HemW [Clostridia bacterium]|nr:radical SAM family heme chaperone HemW [Clostridia bacterium]